MNQGNEKPAKRLMISRWEARLWCLHEGIDPDAEEPVLDDWRKKNGFWFCLKRAPSIYRTALCISNQWFIACQDSGAIDKMEQLGRRWVSHLTALGKVIRLLFGPVRWFETENWQFSQAAYEASVSRETSE